MPQDVQLDNNGRLRHFISLQELPRELIEELLTAAESFIDFATRDIKKVPLLRGKTVVNLFFEPSTRTRTTFEIAAKRLSADVINLQSDAMSTTKGGNHPRHRKDSSGNAYGYIRRTSQLEWSRQSDRAACSESRSYYQRWRWALFASDTGFAGYAHDSPA